MRVNASWIFWGETGRSGRTAKIFKLLVGSSRFGVQQRTTKYLIWFYCTTCFHNSKDSQWSCRLTHNNIDIAEGTNEVKIEENLRSHRTVLLVNDVVCSVQIFGVIIVDCGDENEKDQIQLCRKWCQCTGQVQTTLTAWRLFLCPGHPWGVCADNHNELVREFNATRKFDLIKANGLNNEQVLQVVDQICAFNKSSESKAHIFSGTVQQVLACVHEGHFWAVLMLVFHRRIFCKASSLINFGFALCHFTLILGSLHHLFFL